MHLNIKGYVWILLILAFASVLFSGGALAADVPSNFPLSEEKFAAVDSDGDGAISRLDLLNAKRAFNTGTELDGIKLTQLDILELEQYVRSGGGGSNPVQLKNSALSPATLSADNSSIHTLSFDAQSVSADGSSDAVQITIPSAITLNSVNDVSINKGSVESVNSNANTITFDVNPDSSATAVDLSVSLELTLSTPTTTTTSGADITIKLTDSTKGIDSTTVPVSIPATDSDVPLGGEVVSTIDYLNSIQAYARDGRIGGQTVHYEDVLRIIRAWSTGNPVPGPKSSAANPTTSVSGSDSVAPGQTFSVNYKLTNIGNQDANAAGLNINLPQHIELVNIDTEGNGVDSQATVFFDQGISAGETQTTTFEYRVSKTADTGTSIRIPGQATIGTNTDASTMVTVVEENSNDNNKRSENESGDPSNNNSKNPTGTKFISTPSETSVASGQTTTISYTVTNPFNQPRNALVEFTNLPTNISIQSSSGDISQKLLGSSPPGVISSELAADGSATVDVTLAIAQDANLGERDLMTKATITSSGITKTNTTRTTLTVTNRPPLVQRFSGSDSTIDNVDVLSAVNAANDNRKIGGKEVSNLDVLELVNYVND